MLALSHQEWHSGRFAGFDTGPWLLGSSAANTGNGGVKNKIYIESMMSATYTTQPMRQPPIPQNINISTDHAFIILLVHFLPLLLLPLMVLLIHLSLSSGLGLDGLVTGSLQSDQFVVHFFVLQLQGLEIILEGRG